MEHSSVLVKIKSSIYACITLPVGIWCWAWE